MEIKSYKINEHDVENNMVSGEPFVRIGKGDGCGLEGCHCSDGYWISISNGKNGLLAKFNDKAEFERALNQ